jgi:FKBP-type peptidyl-prolyl cis-trans isomerase FklB
MFGANIQSGGFQTINAEIFGQTARKVLNNETLQMSQDEASSFINIMYHKAQRSVFEKNLVAGREFLRNNSSQPGVVTLPSGLQYKIITAGSGARPTPENRVTVHYHGTLIDGTVFDSSVQRGQTIEFGVTQVIRGWTEALQLMQVGAKWILYIPSELAYGETATGRIEPNSTLIFEVELFAIN